MADSRERGIKNPSYLDFISLLQKMWDIAGHEEKILRNRPQETDAVLPVITYKLLNRKPDPHVKTKAPKSMAIYEDPELPNEFYEITLMAYECLIEFQVFAEDDESADEVVDRFDEFLEDYRRFFKEYGVSDLFFNEQGEDETEAMRRTEICKRKLQYTFRFQKNRKRNLGVIQQMAIAAGIEEENTSKGGNMNAEFTRSV